MTDIVQKIHTWTLTCHMPSGESFRMPASVPGCAIADLQRAGRLPADLFYRDAAEQVRAFERCDYTYEALFTLDATAPAELIFERIDTYATIHLNGKELARCENGNIRHTLRLSADQLRVGENTLCVKLQSPVTRVQGQPPREGAFTTERLYTRRMQCTYGWDWVARFVTCGLGSCTLRLRQAPLIPFEGVYIATRAADGDSAQLRVDVTLGRRCRRGHLFEMTLLSPSGEVAAYARRFYKEPLMRTELTVARPQLWYPIGYGEQPLYTFVLCANGHELHRERIGIRTVRIEELPDTPDLAAVCATFKNAVYDKNERTQGFRLKVNDTSILCLGANWVPCVPYTDGDIAARQTEILTRCAAGGVNMLRVWGGGAFESRHFYEECSRLGIMVTQDFLMACGHYPEEDPSFLAQLSAEAAYIARLVRNQPCLMWYSGDNENAVDGCDTDTDYRGRRSAYEGIAPVLYAQDPERRLLASSPYGGSTYASNTVGTTHNTQYLGDLIFPYMEQGDVSDYREVFKRFRARFVAEEPQLGATDAASLCRFLTEEDIYGEDESMLLYHTKGNPGLKKELYTYMSDFAAALLGPFTDGRDRLFKLRYVQYEWVRVVMEQMRRAPRICTGMIFWMMNDCWPAAAGWSLLDYYNRPKAAWYAFRRLAAPVVASIDASDGSYEVHVGNKQTTPATIRGTLTHLGSDGVSVLASREVCATVPAADAAVVLRTPVSLQTGEVLVFDLQTDSGCDRTFYAPGALQLHPCAIDVHIDADAHTITLRAERYTHAVLLDGDILPADNGFSLLPGECRTIPYTPTDGDMPPVVQSYTL